MGQTGTGPRLVYAYLHRYALAPADGPGMHLQRLIHQQNTRDDQARHRQPALAGKGSLLKGQTRLCAAQQVR